MSLPIDLSQFVVDLGDRHSEYWTPFSDSHPRKRYRSKTLTYYYLSPVVCTACTKSFGYPSSDPYRLPRYMLLDLPQDVIRSVARFRLRVHTLRVETATWNSTSSPTCARLV